MRKTVTITFALLLHLCFFSLFSWGQNPRVLAELNPTSILIGEQTQMKVRVISPKGEPSRLILPPDTLMNGVEIIKYELVDSLPVSDVLRELVYDVTLTSFDSAMYLLSNVHALVGDSLYALEAPPTLVVNTVPVNVQAPDEFYDIKDQWKPPFVWRDYLPYIILLLGGGLLLVGGYYLWKRIQRRRALGGQEDTSESPPMDPYQEAIVAIEALRERGLWEKNLVKEYYTELSDILRRYIARRYDLQTSEKTSKEILELFQLRVGKEEMYSELKQILMTSDLAKFAKYLPPSHENVGLFNAALHFIEAGRPVPEEELEKGGEVS